MGDACEAGCFKVQCWPLGDREELYMRSVQLISANGTCGRIGSKWMCEWTIDQSGYACGLYTVGS